MSKTWIISFALAALSLAMLSAVALAKAAISDGQDDRYYNDAKPLASSTSQRPFACDRLALDPVARKRHFDELGPALRSMRKAVRELADGYEFQFLADPKTIAMVAEWAAGERVCCPFFTIQLRMEAEGDTFWLRLTGRKGTKEFIEADGASWIKQ